MTDMKENNPRNTLFLASDIASCELAAGMLNQMEVAGCRAQAAVTRQYAPSDLAGRFMLRSLGLSSIVTEGRNWMEFASPDAVKFDFIVTLSRESAQLYGSVSSRRWLSVLPRGGAFPDRAQEMMDGAMLGFPGNPVWLDWSQEMDGLPHEDMDGGMRTLPELLVKRVEQGRRLHALVNELVRMPASRARLSIPIASELTTPLFA